MRLPVSSNDDLVTELNNTVNKVSDTFLTQIQSLTESSKTKVMLADGTVAEQGTFDPKLVEALYAIILKNCTNSKDESEISYSNNNDTRRIFIKFRISDNKYAIMCHFSLQYNVYLYYKPDYKVMQTQKELSELIDELSSNEEKNKQQEEQVIMEKLQKMGYKDLDEQRLFEVLFSNDALRQQIESDVDSIVDPSIKQKNQRKQELLKTLDESLVEIYHTTPVLIDEKRLIDGEQGCVCTFDLEYEGKSSTEKQSVFSAEKMPESTKKKLVEEMQYLHNTIMNFKTN